MAEFGINASSTVMIGDTTHDLDMFDYLPRDAVFVSHGDAPGAIAAFRADTRSRYTLLQGDKSLPP